jgi:hypothetical protein
MNGADINLARFAGKRIERNLMDSYGRRHVAIHGTWYRVDQKPAEEAAPRSPPSLDARPTVDVAA